jgi:hypothetical protein
VVEAEAGRDQSLDELQTVRTSLTLELAVCQEQVQALKVAEASGVARLDAALHELEQYALKEQALIAAAYEATEVAEAYHTDYLMLASSLARTTSVA